MNQANIIQKLKEIIPKPECELNFSNNFELLCSVMLSAQTTDKAVNKITPTLFSSYPTSLDLSNADVLDVEKIIRPLGLSKVKSKNLVEISKQIEEKFNSIVPNSYEELIKLPGIGRKTANVVLAVGFNIPRIAVDTHVKRVAIRLGLAGEKANELDVEKNLMDMLDKSIWIDAHHLLLLFGRYYCTSQNPKCENCIFRKDCRKQ